MPQLWVRAIRRNSIIRSETIALDGDLLDTIGLLLNRLDLPRPMFLGKHEREWAQFGMTTFTKDHFVEHIPYDKIEIEQFDPNEKKKRSQDPRNG